ncbi:MAG: metallophosphoesterase, partial [Micropruina sp.]|uniref:metallophosphoesterase n=1 Tax=Micropruina sp. TaxID=2737536 RepID=UPI0039E344EE
PPAAARLIAPADGATAGSAAVALTVRSSDPDGGDLRVRFEGRKSSGSGGGAPFTVVAIPDLQNYTYNNRQDTMVRQSQWVVENRARLGTAMVVNLGDLVNTRSNLTQWGHTSAALKVLDDAGVPNTVVAGNHDFGMATGNFTEYDRFFPPSRYLNSRWTPSTARYGGYLGQNLFGADPVDTRNMNNFALFSAGGRDWLVLNLEWEAPQYARDWAAKVLAAHPNRTAILVTHAFVEMNGRRLAVPQRPGGTSAERLWTDFVSQQCQIKLVLNGHFHNGADGEANRSDLNRCGEPVQQILTDYQSRPAGGDGWLRYYTFDPSANTMTARTYSPTLGRFETDADSQFTVPFPLTDRRPAAFRTIGTTTVGSGRDATQTWSGLEPDTWYEWRAVTSDGTSSSTSPTWRVRTPSAPPKDPGIAADRFARSVSNGWGRADRGGAWTLLGSGEYDVSGGAGSQSLNTRGSTAESLLAVNARDVDLRATLSWNRTAGRAAIYGSLVLRRQADGSDYRLKVVGRPSGAFQLVLARKTGGTETVLQSTMLSGIGQTANTRYRVAFRAVSNGDRTTVSAKLWQAGSREPDGWAASATDTAAGLRAGGAIGFNSYLSNSAAAPIRMSVADLLAVRPG